MEKKVSRAKQGLSVSPDKLFQRRLAGLMINESLNPIWIQNSTFDSIDTEKFMGCDHVTKQAILKANEEALQDKLAEMRLQQQLIQERALAKKSTDDAESISKARQLLESQGYTFDDTEG